ALDAATGKEIWKFDVSASQGNAHSRRGVTYWPGEANIPARSFVTAGRRLIALNATTDESVPGFWANSEVRMGVPYNSRPTVFKTLVFIGANVGEQPATGPRATHARMTHAPAQRFGNFIPFRKLVKPATTRGRRRVGRIAQASTTGASI